MERVEIAGRRIALIKKNGNLIALDDACPHLGGSLSRGTLRSDRVICPLHHWSFELGTGRCLDGVAGEKVAVHAAKVEGGKIWVRLSPP